VSEDAPPDATDRVGDGWQAVLDDAEATATEYRERGWEALVVHPGDSVFVDSEERRGLDVVLPGPEYDDLAALADRATFDDVEVFRAEGDGLLYLLVVERAPAAETAVLVPAYYDPGSTAASLDDAREAGEFSLFCRRLGDEYVEFVHDDPDPFLPAAT
jgi:hypothetical protein